MLIPSLRLSYKYSGAPNAFPPFLPSPTISLLESLTSIISIKYQESPMSLNVISGNGGQFSFQAPKISSALDETLDPFLTGTVRELHLDACLKGASIRNTLENVFKRLPALEVLVLSQSCLGLTREPIPCPFLNTIGFFNTQIKEVALVVENYLSKRLLYRVVIIDTSIWPDVSATTKLRRLVPCVDVMVGVGYPVPYL